MGFTGLPGQPQCGELRQAGWKEREGDSRKHGFKLAEAAVNGRGRQPAWGGGSLGVEGCLATHWACVMRHQAAKGLLSPALPPLSLTQKKGMWGPGSPPDWELQDLGLQSLC